MMGLSLGMRFNYIAANIEESRATPRKDTGHRTPDSDCIIVLLRSLHRSVSFFKRNMGLQLIWGLFQSGNKVSGLLDLSLGFGVKQLNLSICLEQRPSKAHYSEKTDPRVGGGSRTQLRFQRNELQGFSMKERQPCMCY